MASINLSQFNLGIIIPQCPSNLYRLQGVTRTLYSVQMSLFVTKNTL